MKLKHKDLSVVQNGGVLSMLSVREIGKEFCEAAGNKATSLAFGKTEAAYGREHFVFSDDWKKYYENLRERESRLQCSWNCRQLWTSRSLVDRDGTLG